MITNKSDTSLLTTGYILTLIYSMQLSMHESVDKSIKIMYNYYVDNSKRNLVIIP